MPDPQTIAVYDAQSTSYANLEEHEDTDTHISNFIKHLPETGLVLDLGCGPGRSAATIREHGFKIDAVDASAQMVALANARYALNARQACFEDIDTDSTYAGIWASFSLLHASENAFPKILSRLQTALQPAGIFHIGMKLARFGLDAGSSRDGLGRFYTYYSEDELRKHLHDAGFSIIEEHLGKGRGLAGTVDQYIRILARRNETKPDGVD